MPTACPRRGRHGWRLRQSVRAFLRLRPRLLAEPPQPRYARSVDRHGFDSDQLYARFRQVVRAVLTRPAILANWRSSVYCARHMRWVAHATAPSLACGYPVVDASSIRALA